MKRKSMFVHYFKTALRHLRKYKVQNLIGIIGLTVGLFCFSVSLYFTRFIFTTDQIYLNYDRLVDLSVWEEGGEEVSPAATLYYAEMIRSMNLPQVEAVSTTTLREFRKFRLLSEEGEEHKEFHYLSSIEVDTFYRMVFQPTFLYGSWEMATAKDNSVILSRTASESLFGKDANPVGKQMKMTSRESLHGSFLPDSVSVTYTIQAVVEDLPANVSISMFQSLSVWVLNENEGLLQNKQNVGFSSGLQSTVLLRMREDLAELKKILQEKEGGHPLIRKEWKLQYTPLGEIDPELIPFVVAINVISTLILFSALLNFFYFQFGVFQNRIREFCIRKVSGATPIHLGFLLLIQLWLITGIAGLIFLCGMEWISNYYSWDVGVANLHFKIDPVVLKMQALQYLCVLLLMEIIPVIYQVFRIQRIAIQKGFLGGKTTLQRRYARNIMLGTQFFITFLFVAATVALYMQSETTSNAMYHGLTAQEKKGIYGIRILSHAQVEEILNQIRPHKSVKDMILFTPENSYLTFEPEGLHRYEELAVMGVDSNYFSFYNLPILAGRLLEGPSQMVMDTRAQLKWNVLGGTCYLNGTQPYTIVGVNQALRWQVYVEAYPHFYKLRGTEKPTGGAVKAYPGKEKELKEFIEQLEKKYGMELSPLRSLYEELHEQQFIENGLRGIIGMLSLTSLLITLLGVYSAITLDTERRQKEMALRKVNGAGKKEIILIFVRSYGILVAGAAMVAFPVFAWVLHVWREMYIEFFTYDFLFWCAVWGIVSLVTGLTLVFKILHIARVNPASLIRNE